MKRKIIHIDEALCDGCGQCVPDCAEGALEIVDGKARLVADLYCDGLGACLGACPTGALTLMEEDVAPFDPEAVEKRLEEQKQAAGSGTGGGCPSGGPMEFAKGVGVSKPSVVSGSALGHWPVQLRLVPENAPFLKNAHLLLAADCVPVAYPNLHADLLQDKVILLGCPKFDDQELFFAKLVAIFRSNDIASVTEVEMEVPCCSALNGMLAQALKQSGKRIPGERIIVSRTGEILSKTPLAADGGLPGM